MPDRDAECPLCNIRTPVYENELASVILDGPPVSPGRTLFLPKRQVENFFETTPYDCMPMLSLLAETRRKTDAHRAEPPAPVPPFSPSHFPGTIDPDFRKQATFP